MRAVIFDMDGLMVDSEPHSQETWRTILADYGYQLDAETVAAMTGRRTTESAQLVLQKYAIPFSVAELVDEKRRRWDARWRRGIPAKKGLFELITTLQQRGVPWAVATSSPRSYAEGMLKQLGLRFQCGALAAGDEVVRGKPHPDVYLLAAERLGRLPSVCLALEDSVPGVAAAQAAGMRVIAIPDGDSHEDAFSRADYVFPSLVLVAQNLDALMDGTV